MHDMLGQRLRSKLRALLPDSVVSLIQDQTGAPHMLHSLRLLKEKGFRPQVAIDIGAFEGQWSRDMRRVFPDVSLLMVEPLPEKRTGLEVLAKEIGAETAYQLLSDQPGEQVVFYLGSCGSSMHRPKRFSASATLTLTTSCLDGLVDGSSFLAPDIVKLDVQGAEDRVLRGGARTLLGTEVLIIELSLVNSYGEGLLLHEMVDFLATRDFYLYDIAGLLRANRTRSVNEVDGVFVRKGSPLWDLHHFLPEGAPEP